MRRGKPRGQGEKGGVRRQLRRPGNRGSETSGGLAAGSAVGEFRTQEGVARQLVTAAAGLEAIGEADLANGDVTALQRARAKELSELRELLERSKRLNEATVTFLHVWICMCARRTSRTLAGLSSGCPVCVM
ncbi:hypothetical protein PR003_g6449 [Phytophthora rubi]|uniref:Uncharacterized protein n=1 Tax=Phytophthora rubi TaxID=129364 RepID=A0A6A3N267_9STRA|nr:hypothetical protein PR002_g6508 [Phytophthora rubi]KAE9042616.1 hypothetical protein PR001_g6125 [Phytophthora rubi]KAE9348392.1 hypothetical protein PR003_g6449 [Phytophthora rubi]